MEYEEGREWVEREERTVGRRSGRGDRMGELSGNEMWDGREKTGGVGVDSRE